MTKSEYIRKKFVEPIAKMIEKLAHPEDRETLRLKLEIWFLRALADYENLSATDITEISPHDLYGENPLEDK